LLDFQSDFYRAPTLATELGGGVLQLNVGPNAAQRIEGPLNDDGGVEIHVKQGGDASHVLVWAPGLGVPEGLAQEYECTNQIIGIGGEGGDIIDCSGVTSGIDYDLEGGKNNDAIFGDGAKVTLDNAGNVIAVEQTDKGKGGQRHDLRPTTTSDLIYGGPGNDEIHGGAGDDTVYGGDGL